MTRFPLAAFLALALSACAAAADDECKHWPTESGRPQAIVVVVDATDGLSPAQGNDVWKRIRPLAIRATPDSAVHIYELTDAAERGFRQITSVKRPRHACEVTIWTGNRKMQRRLWQSRYLGPLKQAVRHALTRGPSGSSAILEVVQAAARHFAADSGRPAREGHLILVSNLMQHRGGANFYERIPSLADFKETRSYRELRTRHLRDVQLTVLQLPTGSARVDDDARTRFWTDYFEDQGMRRVRSGFHDVEGPMPVPTR